MLYFSKFRITLIAIFTIIFAYLTTSNFVKFDDGFLEKKINLGLDLQGGSYLLLEIDNDPVIVQRLQNKISSLRSYFKKNNINYKNLKVEKNNTISFELKSDFVEKFISELENEESEVNPYYDRFKSHKYEYIINKNLFNLKFSKYGLIEIKNSSLDQALEIVRRRIDEVGTNEPTIIKRGNDRILIELPGLSDPNRIKKLLGKTANLSFRIVTDQADDFGSEVLFQIPHFVKALQTRFVFVLYRMG